MNKIILLTFVSILMSSSISCAAPLIYHGNNPNITPSASSFNASAIDARAALTRPKERTAQSTQSDAELVRRSALASVSSSISQKLVGNDPLFPSGRVDFGDGSYAVYSTGLVNGVNTRTIQSYNLDGSSTTISFPL